MSENQQAESNNLQNNSDEFVRSKANDLADPGFGAQASSPPQEEDLVYLKEDQAPKATKTPPLQDNKDKQEIADLKAKLAELDDNYQRLWADQQNMLKRFQREKQDLYKSAAIAAIENIIPALDNFDFAKKSINAETHFEDFIKSLDMLQSHILMSLKAMGLEEIDTNLPFNPELHEAVTSVPNPELEEGTIIEVAKKGYKLKDRVIRAAAVVVSSK